MRWKLDLINYQLIFMQSTRKAANPCSAPGLCCPITDGNWDKKLKLFDNSHNKTQCSYVYMGVGNQNKWPIRTKNVKPQSYCSDLIQLDL